MKKLYLIRHGETECNRERRIQGNDVELTEKGKSQAAILKKAIENKHFDKIYASDLYRVRQTIAILFDENTPIEYDTRLREVDNTVFAGRLRSEVEKEYVNVYSDCARYLDFTPIGGESSESLLKRTASFLTDIDRLDGDDLQIAVITHGGTIRALISSLIHIPLDAKTMIINNCTITEFVYQNGIWRLTHINNSHPDGI